MPIGAKSARAEAEMARLQAEQTRIEADRIQAKVALEVDTVLSRIETDRQRVATGRKSRQIAGEAMAGEIKRLGEGVSTTYQVLQYQNEYSQTRSRELAALADLNKDQVDLWLVTGSLLQNQGIELKDIVDPELETRRKWRVE
jgi:outer membrane protein TolC